MVSTKLPECCHGDIVEAWCRPLEAVWTLGAPGARGYSYLHLADERVLVSFSLNELERRLRGHFFRTHRSYLVNLDHVRELVPDFKGSLVLVMDDRQRSRVEVSRRQARELRRVLGM